MTKQINKWISVIATYNITLIIYWNLGYLLTRFVGDCICAEIDVMSRSKTVSALIPHVSFPSSVAHLDDKYIRVFLDSSGRKNLARAPFDAAGTILSIWKELLIRAYDKTYLSLPAEFVVFSIYSNYRLVRVKFDYYYTVQWRK